MIINRGEVEMKEESYIPPQGDSKTFCRDAETCESLNRFLDIGYGIPATLGFGIQCTKDCISTTLDLTGFGEREKAEIIARMIHFVMNELNRVKNGH